MAHFQEQLSRVRRFLKRIETHDRPFEDYDDDMWSFFQNCWHLKDWIKNDPSVLKNVPPKKIEEEAKKYADLMVCADLAIAAKHFYLRNPRASPSGARLSHKNYSITVGSGESSKVEYFVDRGSGSRVDALTLARDCIVAWEKILNKFNLPLN